MIPILFESNINKFDTKTMAGYFALQSLLQTHGIGDLMEATECQVTQNSEGEFELSFQYPPNGTLYSELTIGRIVAAKANNWLSSYQMFRIYGIEKNINGMTTVSCQHISYDLGNYPVKTFKNVLMPSTAISTMLDADHLINVGSDTLFPFKVSGYSISPYSNRGTYSKGDYVTVGGVTTFQCIQDIPTAEGEFNPSHWVAIESFSLDTPTSLRAALLDGDSSVLGFYGGDIIFDNCTVQLQKSGGADRGVVIEYGIDLIDLTQEKNISEMITGVIPYWKGTIRGNSESTNYTLYTGDTFESGVTYYARVPSYSPKPSSIEHYTTEQSFYVNDGGYRALEIWDLDFCDPDYRNVTYYEATDPVYTETPDIDPASGTVYYILENGKYRRCVLSDFDFRSGVTYYDAPEASAVTQDEHYNWQKTYYIESTLQEYDEETQEPVGEVTYVPVIGQEDLGFKTGITYWEQTVTEYTATTDKHYDRTKTYYVTSPTLGSFIEADISYFDFGVADPATGYTPPTYYVISGYSYSVVRNPTAGGVYYVTESYTDEEKYVYGTVQYAEGCESLPNGQQKIQPLDLSEYFFAETPEELQRNIKAEYLNKKAKEWILINDIGVPAIDLTVSYADIMSSPYMDQIAKKNIRLYDAVTVRFAKLGIDVKAKVTSYTYDVLKERCTEIEVSNAKASSEWSSLEDASRLRRGMIPPKRIGSHSITSEHIATGAVGGSNIASDGISGWHLVDGAVTETKVKDGAVTVAKIQNGAVVAEKIAAGAVNSNKILDKAIELKKLDEDLQLFYSDVVAAMTIMADRALIDRYVDAAGYYGDTYFIRKNGAAYSMSLHTHELTLDSNGNLKIGAADWTGGDHKINVKAKAVFGA